ncbi:retrovirus-related pol polyprotein from transposon TNT 1-94, partial [Tanacetum coccineum]
MTNVKNNKDISATTYVELYTYLKSYEPHAMKTLKKQEQSTSIVDPLAYLAQTTHYHAPTQTTTPPPPQYGPLISSTPQQVPQSSNDAMLATMNQIVNLLSGFQKQFPPTNNQLRTSSNSRSHATMHDGQIITETIQRRAPSNCKEKGTVLDAKAEAFLVDVECTAPYDQPLAITTTNMFEVSHKDTYDSDVDEGPHAAAAFMANLSSISGTNGATTSQVNEVHTDANQIFDNVNHLLTHEMHQEEHLDSDVESDIDDNTIPYHQYQLDSEVQDVLTKTLKKQEQSTSIVDPLAYLAQTTHYHAPTQTTTPPPPQYGPLTSSTPQQVPQSSNDAMTSSNSRSHATVHDGQIITETVQRRAPGNVGNTGNRGTQNYGQMTDNVGKKVICYNCRGEGHVSRQCKEKKRVKDSQYFKDKMLLMEAKEKGTILDAEAEAFLADVECTAPYDQPLAITTTNMFEVSHEDAYDSDVDEGPHVTFLIF